MDDNQQPQRGRPRNAASVEGRRERRRTGANTETAGLKLAIPDWVSEKYPEKEYAHRWFSARPGRLEWAKGQDWDPVEGVKPVSATDKDGHRADHVLHVKYRDWYENDRAPRETTRKELEKQMLRGAVKERGEGSGETLSEKFQYEEAVSQNRLS